jgi:ABC-type bacteriocin/lantibiotic exporter with double-glycine peptidase domain
MVFVSANGGPQPAKLIKIPQTGQAKFYTCGVAVMQSLLYYNGIERDQEELEPALGSSPAYGTSIDSMRRFLNENNIDAELLQNLSLRDLRGYIDSGRVIVCLMQAWDDEPGHDYTDTWNDGHYIVAIGYDDDRIYFMDPYTIANYCYIENNDFLTRWHGINLGVRYLNAGIVVANPNPVYNPGVFVPIE